MASPRLADMGLMGRNELARLAEIPLAVLDDCVERGTIAAPVTVGEGRAAQIGYDRDEIDGLARHTARKGCTVRDALLRPLIVIAEPGATVGTAARRVEGLTRLGFKAKRERFEVHVLPIIGESAAQTLSDLRLLGRIDAAHITVRSPPPDDETLKAV